MKRSSTVVSAAVVMIAGGSILAGSIVSAKGLPADAPEPPAVSTMVILTPGESLIECTFPSIPPGLSQAHESAVPDDAVDLFPSDLSSRPGDFVSVDPHASASTEQPATGATVDMTTARPGTAAECDQATNGLLDGGPPGASSGVRRAAP